MLRLSRHVLLFAAAALSCRGCGPIITPIETGFRIDEKELDYGRVLEGQMPVQQIHVVSTGQGSLSLTLGTLSPFSVTPTLELPGGTTVAVDVTFNAGSTPEEKTLTVTSSGGEVLVTLKGIGVHPLECVPSRPCRESRYILDTNTCLETVVADGGSCTPMSTCLEKGQCVMGECQGVARSCDDNNLCTIDGCAEGIGCVNSVRACPPPTAACKVATCDPGTGCGEAQATDGTVCGSVDCMQVHICNAGQCAVSATPDGFPCSPPTPCQGPGACRMGSCRRPDAGVMQPELVLNVGGAPPQSRPMLLSYAGQLFGELCDVRQPLIRVELDGGPLPDGGVDFTFVDGGLGCALISFTNNGFERFTLPFGDSRERSFVHVANIGAALLDDGGFELRSLGSGALRAAAPLPGPVAAKGVASSLRGDPWLLSADADGGASTLSRFVLDAGFEVVASLDAGVQLLAVDEQGGAWVYGSSALGYVGFDDAGLVQPTRWTPAVPALTSTLATSGGVAFAGAVQFVGLRADAGFIPALGWVDDAGQPLRVQERFSLIGQNRAFLFYRRCAAPLTSCPVENEELRLRTVSLLTGEELDDAQVSNARFDAKVVEATMLELTGFPPGVAALIQLHSDAGAAAYLQLTIGSQGDLTCPLPPDSDVAGAAIGAGYLWAYLNRDGGAYTLEAYPLTGLPLALTAWPLADGIAGQRRAR